MRILVANLVDNYIKGTFHHSSDGFSIGVLDRAQTLILNGLKASLERHDDEKETNQWCYI
jgi:hypothetical protein